MIMDGIANETLSKVSRMLQQQYLIDSQRSINQFYPFCRPVHPDEAEGYEDISELDDYMIVVAGLTWTIKKIPPCLKEEMEKRQQKYRVIYNKCNNCNESNDCDKCDY